MRSWPRRVRRRRLPEAGHSLGGPPWPTPQILVVGAHLRATLWRIPAARWRWARRPDGRAGPAAAAVAVAARGAAAAPAGAQESSSPSAEQYGLRAQYREFRPSLSGDVQKGFEDREGTRRRRRRRPRRRPTSARSTSTAPSSSSRAGRSAAPTLPSTTSGDTEVDAAFTYGDTRFARFEQRHDLDEGRLLQRRPRVGLPEGRARIPRRRARGQGLRRGLPSLVNAVHQRPRGRHASPRVVPAIGAGRPRSTPAASAWRARWPGSASAARAARSTRRRRRGSTSPTGWPPWAATGYLKLDGKDEPRAGEHASSAAGSSGSRSPSR